MCVCDVVSIGREILSIVVSLSRTNDPRGPVARAVIVLMYLTVVLAITRVIKLIVDLLSNQLPKGGCLFLGDFSEANKNNELSVSLHQQRALKSRALVRHPCKIPCAQIIYNKIK